MDNLGFGLWMTAMGMGTVFVLLLGLLLVLRVIGWFDSRGQTKRASAAQTVTTPDEAAEGPQAPPSGLSDAELAAISIAVITHARVRRRVAAPVMRAHEPGSHLFASRWVAIGRGYQHRPWSRGN